MHYHGALAYLLSPVTYICLFLELRDYNQNLRCGRNYISIGIITGGMTPTARAVDQSSKVKSHCEMYGMVSFIVLLIALALCAQGTNI